MAINVTTIGPGTLTLGVTGTLTTLTEQCTKARLIPSVSQSDPIPVLSGASAPGKRAESWSLEIELLQDWKTAGTSKWLFDHRGEKHAFSYTPNTVGATKASGEVIVEAIEFGGDAGSPAKGTVTLALTGAPTITG